MVPAFHAFPKFLPTRMAMSRRSSVCFLPGLSLGIPSSYRSKQLKFPMAMIQMNHLHLLQTLFRHHAIDLKVCDLMVITTVTTLKLRIWQGSRHGTLLVRRLGAQGKQASHHFSTRFLAHKML